jgi:hypothetical protein
MFYKRIDLRKLYEAMDSVSMEDSMPVDFTSSRSSEPAANSVESAPVSQSTEAEASTEGTVAAPKKEKVEIAKGNTYALPLGKTEIDELTKLASQGPGVEWKGTTPLKTVASGKEGEPATLTLGESQKPIYLTVKLVANKGEQKGLSLNLEADDRYYVAWITTPAALLDNLDTATDLSNSVKVSVKTPVIDKTGKNIEHSLEVWKDTDAIASATEAPAPSDDSSDYEESKEDLTSTNYGMPVDREFNTPTISDVTVDSNLAMEAPGTAAGFDAAVESKAISSFDDYLRKTR